MADILIRDVPEDVIAAIDEKAQRLTFSLPPQPNSRNSPSSTSTRTTTSSPTSPHNQSSA
jgi:hypothetical protein